ncbi:MAG TPA: LytR C-terminal domain-containing protein [Rectinema sp.]|nr:LytR C-terminal domain-containing protein [Rectinema sp.]
MSDSKSKILKRSSLPLLVILIVVAIGLFFVVRLTEKGTVESIIKKDQPMAILFIFESDKKPVSNQLLIWYPSKRKAAIMDIPSTMGIILKSANKMSSIDTVYDSRNPSKFVKEISDYLKYPIDGWFVYDEVSLCQTIDLLEGIQMFIPETVIESDSLKGVSLPGGAVVLDGDKTNQYLLYALATDSYSEEISRKQRLLINMLGKLADESTAFNKNNNIRLIASKPKSNFSLATRVSIFKYLAQIDYDMIITQFISGSFRSFEERRLLFPYYDGELARDVVSQTAKALGVEENEASQKTVVTIDILNGCGEKGLANTASILFESYGYKVVSVGNAPSFDYAKTIMYDNDGDKAALQQVANIINCRNFGDASALPGLQKANITIILGKDFNGRYCIGQ